MPETVTPAGEMAPAPIMRSPLAPAGTTTVVAGYEYCEGSVGGPVVVADRSAITKVHVKVASSPAVIEALGTRFGRAAWVEDLLVVGSGPDEWLVLGAPARVGATADQIEKALEAADVGLLSVVDLTHGRALMRIHGARTMPLMGRVTGVDLDDRLVPDGSALRTSVAGVVTDLIRDDLGGEPSFLLHCERSSGRYLQQSLLSVGADLGVVAGSSGPAWPDRGGG